MISRDFWFAPQPICDVQPRVKYIRLGILINLLCLYGRIYVCMKRFIATNKQTYTCIAPQLFEHLITADSRIGAAVLVGSTYKQLRTVPLLRNIRLDNHWTLSYIMHTHGIIKPIHAMNGDCNITRSSTDILTWQRNVRTWLRPIMLCGYGVQHNHAGEPSMRHAMFMLTTPYIAPSM